MARGNGAAPATAETVNGGRKDTPGKRPSSRTGTANPQPSWRDVLPIHPAADLFPLIESKAELKEIGEDIKKRGLQARIAVVEQRGQKPAVLDGRNRLDAMELVGLRPVLDDGQIDYSIVSTQVVEEDDAYAYVVSANMHRRHLTADDQRKVIAALLKANPEKSNREIARQVKDDHKKVGRVRDTLEATGALPQLGKTVGKDGKARPTKKRRTADDLKPDVAAKKAAVASAMPAKIVRDSVAPDEELALLREFARWFVSERARVTYDVRDRDEWRMLFDRIKAVLGAAP